MSRIAWLELDDAPQAPAESPAPVEAPAPAPTVEPERIETHAQELNGSLIQAGSDGLTARASGDVRSAHSLAAAADLAWDPVIAPLTVGGAEVPATLGRAVVRSDTRAPIGIVGARYHAVPHSVLFDLADAIAGASKNELRFANAGHKADGARPFVQMRMAGRVGSVEAETLVSLFTSHDGTLCLSAGFSKCVVVCRNTYAHALSDSRAGLKIKHTASADALISQALDIAKLVADYDVSWNNAALSMMSQKFTDSQFQNFAKVLLPGDSTKSVNMRERLTSAWISAPGAAPGSVWGAAQAVTYYTSHHAGSAESREETSIFGTGIGADLQEQAWWILTAGDESAVSQRLEQKLFRA